jgi:hypothetical protein
MTERGIGTKEARLTVDDEPTRSPAVTETMQIGIVVRDLDAAMRRYVDGLVFDVEVDVGEPRDEPADELREGRRPSERLRAAGDVHDAVGGERLFGRRDVAAIQSLEPGPDVLGDLCDCHVPSSVGGVVRLSMRSREATMRHMTWTSTRGCVSTRTQLADSA